MNTRVNQRDFEQSIYEAIMAQYYNTSIPETVLIAVSDGLDILVIGTYGHTSIPKEAAGWNIEEIDTDDLSDNIAETASCYFDPRYFN